MRTIIIFFCCCSVPKMCPTLCSPMDCSTPGFPVLLYLLELAQTHVHRVSDAIQPSHPVVPFSSCLQSLPAAKSFLMSQSTPRIRKPKFWNFSFSISPSNECSELTSFRMDRFDLLAVQRTLKSLLQHHGSKASIFRHSAFFTSLWFMFSIFSQELNMEIY